MFFLLLSETNAICSFLDNVTTDIIHYETKKVAHFFFPVFHLVTDRFVPSWRTTGVTCQNSLLPIQRRNLITLWPPPL